MVTTLSVKEAVRKVVGRGGRTEERGEQSVGYWNAADPVLVVGDIGNIRWESGEKRLIFAQVNQVCWLVPFRFHNPELGLMVMKSLREPEAGHKLTWRWAQWDLQPLLTFSQFRLLINFDWFKISCHWINVCSTIKNILDVGFKRVRP